MQAPALLLALALMAATGPAGAEEPYTPTREQMLSAATAMKAASEAVLERKLEMGLWPGAEIDPNRTGLIGQEYTPSTTTAATLANKRTATNPDFAAALVRLLAGEGIGSDSTVLLVQSGSFLGANIAALTALEALDAKVVLVLSLGSSQWGANDPELNLLEIWGLLHERGVVDTVPVAVVIGGAGAVGGNMEPDGLDRLRPSFARHDEVPLVEVRPTSAVVARLREMIATAAGGEDEIDLMIKTGGSVVSVGACRENYLMPTGLVPRPRECSGTPGLFYLVGDDRLKMLNILAMKQLAAELGLPYDPMPMPALGQNPAVYGEP
jgi:poly-gamma-glutamate system protein